MATSRPIRQGDSLTRLNDEGPRGYGASRIALGSENTREFALHEDFGLTRMFDSDYRRAVCDRVFGVPNCANFRDPRLAAAITNGTAPGLYVREGDDTSDWETYRQVLARRVEEAMAARRGGASGGETAREGAAARAAARAMSTATTSAAGDVVDPVVGVYPGPVTPTPQSQQPPVSVQPQLGGERETTASRIRQGVQRDLDRLYPPSPPQSPLQPPSPPSRFSLLEIDTDAALSLPQSPKASTGLTALQQELRAEREARRALAAAQTPPGRFDLLECDLPAVPVAPVVAIKSPQPSSRPAASPPPPRRPAETITDLTAARSPHELARMLEGLNDELLTMMRQREVN